MQLYLKNQKKCFPDFQPYRFASALDNKIHIFTLSLPASRITCNINNFKYAIIKLDCMHNCESNCAIQYIHASWENNGLAVNFAVGSVSQPVYLLSPISILAVLEPFYRFLCGNLWLPETRHAIFYKFTSNSEFKFHSQKSWTFFGVFIKVTFGYFITI